MAGKTPPRPQQSKRDRAAKSVPVRAHQRTLKDAADKPAPRRLSLAERFRGQR